MRGGARVYTEVIVDIEKSMMPEVFFNSADAQQELMALIQEILETWFDMTLWPALRVPHKVIFVDNQEMPTKNA